MDIETLLSPLIEDIKNEKFSTKQKTYKQHIKAIITSIDLFGWKKFVEYMNKKMGDDLSLNTYKTMVYRCKKTKKEIDIVQQATSIKENKTNNPLFSLSKKEKNTEYNPTPNKSRIYGDE
ncbi:hypothetical protein [Arsenophonus sp.]|uniref:hypothetical protein n=1 Tax=Arsenophonus sp. TaxID=1872640 RepID=UPI00285B64CD|nr:hypothetical protein [Arsenophonus sp.]MDR5614933.1 hypothetical protein [Arsenophonus sp.]